jgi:hypothetical protein
VTIITIFEYGIALFKFLSSFNLLPCAHQIALLSKNKNEKLGVKKTLRRGCMLEYLNFNKKLSKRLLSEVFALETKEERVKKLIRYLRFSAIKTADLKCLYQKAVEEACRLEPFMFLKTEGETVVANYLTEITKLKVYTSFLCGPYSLDLFIPGVRAQGRSGLHGIAIEVDGGSHLHPVKMSKDNYKYDFLQSLRIAVMSLTSRDELNRATRSALDGIKLLKRLDTRGRERVMRRVYVNTICSWINSKNYNDIITSIEKQ